MKAPLVSICIPTYNGEEYIEQCLQSCIDQAFDQYEILVCDDGSKDSTVRIIEKYLLANPGIRLICNAENLGLVGNWNKCIREARGAWIKFVFQDDYIAPDCLMEFMKAVTPGAMLLVSERDFILPANADDDMRRYYGQVVRTLKNTSDHSPAHYPASLISRIAVQNMSMNFIGEPSLVLFKKEVALETGFFNPALKQICDLEFVLRVASRYGLTYVPQKICSFRIHRNTTTSANVAGNYFVLHYIEPLILSYLLLYDRHFAPLRKNLNLFLWFKLWLYFRVKAYQAYRVDKEQNQGHFLFMEKQEVFKEIWEVRKGSFFVRLISRFLS